MALGSAHKVAHTLENRYKTNTVKANSLIMNYVAYMRVHILTIKFWYDWCDCIEFHFTGIDDM